MPDNGSVFNADNANSNAPSIGTDGNILEVLVGDGRKYKTVEDLAKGYINADEFVETLKGENATLKEQLVKAKTVEDVLERLNKANERAPADQPVKVEAPDIARIVKETVTGLETQKVREMNLSLADRKMAELFGEKAQEVFNSYASTPELKATLTQLASVSPDKFIAIFDKRTEQNVSSSASTGGVNTAAFGMTKPAVSDPSTKFFYDEMRRKQPQKYYSQEVQLAMHKAAQANPNKFFGRN
jgi:hypothetical protein